MKTKLVVVFVLLVLVLVFILQNTEAVTIGFLFWDFHISRSLLIFLMALLGFIAGVLVRRKAD